MLISDDFRKTLYLCLYFLLTTASSFSFASNDLALTDEDFFSDIPTVITVSRLEQPKSEAPSSVTIITREMIQASGFRQIANVFSLAPGFIVGHIQGNKPVVTYHGMGYDFNRQLQVLIDGRSVFIPSFGGIPWESLPLSIEDIEKIEITRGPNAASYGSNSFLAVINIITKEAFQDVGTYLSTAYSSDHSDVQDIYVSHSFVADHYDWRLSLETQHDDGFEALNTNPNNDSERTKKYNFRSNFLIDHNSQWSVQLGGKLGDLTFGDDSPFDIKRIEENKNNFQSLSYEYSTLKSSTNFNLYHTEHDVKDSFDISFEVLPSTFTSATVGFDRYSERTELEIESTYDWSNQFRLVYGGSIRKDTVDSFFLLGEDQKQSLDIQRLFLHSEYKHSKDIIINLGGMIEKSDAADTAFSPRLSYIQHLNKQQTVRFSYSKAFRNPILFELDGRWAFTLNDPLYSAFSPLEFNQGNPDLVPEEINSIELGLNSQVNSHLKTDLKIYQYELSDQIEVDRTITPNRFINHSFKTKSKGLELSISYKPSRQLLISSGINYNSTSSPDQNFKESYPSYSGFILAQYDKNQHAISGHLHYQSEMSWVDSSTQLNSTKRLDLRYAYDLINTYKLPLKIEIIGQNLLSDYTDYLNRNIHSKSFFVKLGSQF